MTTYTPGWFSRALAAPFSDRTVEVDGVPIHYLYWAGAEDGAARRQQRSPGHRLPALDQFHCWPAIQR